MKRVVISVKCRNVAIKSPVDGVKCVVVDVQCVKCVVVALKHVLSI